MRIFTHTRVDGHRRATTAAVRGVRTEWGDIECEVVVNAGGMFAAEIGRLAGVRVPIVPFAHEYLVTSRSASAGDAARLPTLRDPDLLVYFREEGDGLVMGGYERHRAPWSLDEHARRPHPADFNGRLLEEDWDALRGDRRQLRSGACRRWTTSAVTQLINGPEAFTPDNEFCLGETEVGGLLRRRRLLRARPRRRRRHRQGDGRVDRRRRAVAGRVAHGRAPLRRRTTARRRTR